ncbi:hypothetical protein ALC62_14002 [Cyphomyrmex costatus]|uniref:DDE-1 domain-containing protein n=1 Tax=Cyphomyrmex costatus TaxID=456900 RepID=A0A151I9A8_9HYME|nr:hypothetical protein ALC62_14002 [Cyphomyrmex costatus]
MILYAYERIPGPIVAAAPAEWSLGRSKNGWMTQESFYEYVTSVFYKWCLDNHLEFPIILFVDGHRSHLTLALSHFCVQHQIELIALYPNATHFLQPMDVALFRPLKLNWSKVVSTWRMEHGGVSVDKVNFALLLNKAISMLDTKRILGNGFKACGLHPFSPDAVDYSRLLQSNKTHKNQYMENKEAEDKKSCIQFIEKNIFPKTLECFKINKTGIWTGEIRDTNLFYFWLRATSKVNPTQENLSTIEQKSISEYYQLATQACPNEGSQDASIENIHSILNSSVINDENLSPNMEPAECLNVKEGKNLDSIVNLDEKATQPETTKNIATSNEWRAYHQDLIEKKKKMEEEKRLRMELRLEKQKIKKEKEKDKKIKKQKEKEKKLKNVSSK